MEPPEGPLPVSKHGGNTPPAVTKLSNETIEGKQSYATRVTAPSSSTSNPTRPEKDKVIARQTTHNGIPSVIFKAKYYYSIMAESCKYTIVR